ncbi:hypothetical protein COP1_017726 [Malus domestica]
MPSRAFNSNHRTSAMITSACRFLLSSFNRSTSFVVAAYSVRQSFPPDSKSLASSEAMADRRFASSAI